MGAAEQVERRTVSVNGSRKRLRVLEDAQTHGRTFRQKRDEPLT